MSRNVLTIAIVILSVSLFTFSQEASAQSGSRGGGGGGGVSSGGGGGGSLGSSGVSTSGSRFRRRGLSVIELAYLQQQANLQRQALLDQQRVNTERLRQQTLTRFASNPDAKQNKDQYIAAFKDAKAEFKAIRNGQRPVACRNLDRIFVLRTKEFNRVAGDIKWPNALKDEAHMELTESVSDIASGKGDAATLQESLKQLNQQLEERVVDKSISIRDYATAKRFVSGLANEAML